MKEKTIYILVFIILFFLIGVKLDIFSTFNIQDKNFYQYTGRPCTSICAEWSNLVTTSANPIFNIGGDTFEFRTSVTDLCGFDNNGYVLRSCCETIEVYRDGTRIDTLGSGYQGTFSGQNTAQVKTYQAGDGMTAITAGVNVERWYYSGCNSIRNTYMVVFPKNEIDVTINPIKNIYFRGENISVPVSITNNFQPLEATIKINYNLDTILGKVTRTTEQNVSLAKGTTTFNLDILSTMVAENLEITPEIELFFLTSDITGVNYPISGSIRPITQSPRISIGSVIGDTSKIMIAEPTLQCNSDEDCEIPCAGVIADCVSGKCSYSGQCNVDVVEVGCIENGCPTGYNCNSELNVCQSVSSSSSSSSSSGSGSTDSFDFNQVLFELWGFEVTLLFLLIGAGLIILIISLK